MLPNVAVEVATDHIAADQVAAALSNVSLTVSPQIRAALVREQRRLGRPGPTMTAAERVAIVELLRSDRPDSRALTAADVDLVRALAYDPAGIDENFVEALSAGGLADLRALEIVAVLSRQIAVARLLAGVGGSPIALATPEPGAPTGQINSWATRTIGFYPTLHQPYAPTALAALPSEQDAVMDLHGALYLTPSEVMQPGVPKSSPALSRTQVEFAAARTSYLNECVY